MRIGPYETVSELGRGGMGIVYRARSKDGRDVALKLLVSAHPDALSRFERETRLQELLSEKEGFVPLLDRGSSPQGPYVVMPLLEGGTLQDRLKRGPLEVEETRALGERLASTLGKATRPASFTATSSPRTCSSTAKAGRSSRTWAWRSTSDTTFREPARAGRSRMAAPAPARSATCRPSS